MPPMLTMSSPRDRASLIVRDRFRAWLRAGATGGCGVARRNTAVEFMRLEQIRSTGHQGVRRAQRDVLASLTDHLASI